MENLIDQGLLQVEAVADSFNHKDALHLTFKNLSNQPELQFLLKKGKKWVNASQPPLSLENITQPMIQKDSILVTA